MPTPTKMLLGFPEENLMPPVSHGLDHVSFDLQRLKPLMSRMQKRKK